MPSSKTIKKALPRFKGGTKNNKNKTYKKVLNLIKNPNSYYAFTNTNLNYNETIEELEKTNINKINESYLEKLLQELEAVRLNKYSPNELGELRALVGYESSPFRDKLISKRHGEFYKNLNDMTVENRIRAILARQKPLEEEKLVWRGQNKVKQNNIKECKILPISWFSTSTDKRIAKIYSTRGRCLFKIHLMPGVRCFDLYDIYKEYGMTNPYKEQKKLRALLHYPTYSASENYSQYGEVIVEEGGRFCKDPQGKEEGFLDAGKEFQEEGPNIEKTSKEGKLVFKRIGYKRVIHIWETWYFPPPPDYKSPNKNFNWNNFGDVHNGNYNSGNEENNE